MPRPEHPAQSIKLAAISCRGPSFCLAVGDYTYGVGAMPGLAGSNKTLAERWDGSTWKIQQVPDVNEIGYTQLTAVSCSSDSACMAVGTYNGGTGAISELWNGTSWKLYPMPDPPQPESLVQPAGLSCTEASACVAVGTDGGTLAETWLGARWRMTLAVRP